MLATLLSSTLVGLDGRIIRVYRTLDTRLLLADLYAKLALHAG